MKLSEAVVHAVLDELSGRGGFDMIDMLKHDDKEVYDEMLASCVQAVEATPQMRETNESLWRLEGLMN